MIAREGDVHHTDPTELILSPPTTNAEFGDWYAATYPNVVRAVLALTRDPAAAEDAAADAFTKAFTRWSSVSEMSDPSAWVYRVAVNSAKLSWRRARRRLSRSTRTSDVVSMPEGDTDLWRAVDELPHRQRQVVVLRYVSGLTEPRIAAVLKISVGAVSASLTTARRKLANDSRVVR